MAGVTEEFAFEAMGGPCALRLPSLDGGGDAKARADAAREAIAEVRRIEAKYSRYRPDSVVSRVNAAAGGPPVRIDPETAQLLEFADNLYRVSGGLFDITSGVLRRAWDFSRPGLPDERLLAVLLALVDWPSVERGNGTVRLPRAGMQLDFGGFGKEYAADRAAAALSARGITHGYVNLGGDIRVIGPQPDGEPWQLGVRHPRDEGALLAALPLWRGALATSGDYERFFVLDGRRYAHILNPRTGYPVAHWQSVSVAAPLCSAAGALCTIAMLLGEPGLEFLAVQGEAFLAVDPSGHVHRHQFDLP